MNKIGIFQQLLGYLEKLHSYSSYMYFSCDFKILEKFWVGKGQLLCHGVSYAHDLIPSDKSMKFAEGCPHPHDVKK